MSNIEWTEKTWNPVIGCTPVSPGCLNCYAATMANRMQQNPKAPEYKPREVPAQMGTPYDKYEPARTVRIAEVRGGRAVFTGEVRCLPERLMEPLRWRKPSLVFVNSMSDLFHESVPFDFIDRVFAVMALCPRHTFQVLTKRPERMAEYFASFANDTEVDGSWGVMRLGCAAGKLLDGGWVWDEGKRHRQAIERFICDAHEENDESSGYEAREVPWPLPNVWLGTSVENQATADQRIPHLLRCPAAIRFLSCEPLLERVDLRLNREVLTDLMDADADRPESHRGRYPFPSAPSDARTRRADWLHWVIVGGESGPNARPCDVDWHRSIIGQCAGAGVPCFVKQLGARTWVGFYSEEPLAEWSREREQCVWNPDGLGRVGGVEAVSVWHPRDGQPRSGATIEVRLRDRKGGDPAEWPVDLRVRQFPGGVKTAKA